MGRFALPAPLVSKQAAVRELDAPDAESLVAAAGSVTVVLGSIGVPTDVDAASAMLSEWEGLRRDGMGNLFGVFSSSTHALVGVIGIRQTDDFVAELGAWNTRRGAARKQLAEAVVLVTAWAHEQHLRRVWVEIDPLDDEYSKYFSFVAGYVLEGQVRTATGEIKDRYSSVG